MLSVVHANHIEDLRDIALAMSEQAPLAPLETETFLVQSQGMGQWLNMAIAEREGIAAAVEFLLPSSFVWKAFRAVLGDEVPRQSPFDRKALVWRLMSLLPHVLEQPAFAPLKEYLHADTDAGNTPTARHRYQLAERLAALFDQYLVYRPDWMEAFSEGRTPADLHLPAEQQWQPALWQALLAAASPAQRRLQRAALQRRFNEQLKHLDRPPRGLPSRLFVFGISSLPLSVIEALSALSEHLQVVLLLTNPSQFYWGDIISEREAIQRSERERRRHPQRPGLAGLDPDELHLRANPLLAGWGAQGRDFIQSLYAFEQDEQLAEADVFRSWAEGADASLLQQLKQDILTLAHPMERAAEEGGKRPIAADDDSLRLFSCHSPLREIEVLHDLLLDAFERDSSLKPRDIIVQVPDIDAYAPFIEAIFGRFEREDERYIPFSIADRRASQASPLLAAVLTLLNLPESRLSVSEVLDLLDLAPLRRRFGISAEELATLARWVEQSGIRWGLSAQHRHLLGLPSVDANSWQFGLKRMLLGYAMGDVAVAGHQGFDEIAPYDEVQGLDADLAGRLIDLVEALEQAVETLATPRPPHEWVACIEGLLDTFLDLASDEEFAVINRFSSALQDFSECCEAAACQESLPQEVVHSALSTRLDENAVSPRFLAGRVNFATLMPMRAIPFRKVYLLGMNDGEFPRPRVTQDFDLMASHPRPGDRSRRDDDRYLMLDALLSARDQLTIGWVGFDQRSNQPRPPSVLVSELMDTVSQGFVVPGHEGAADQHAALLERLISAQPLQPFSKRYFGSGGDRASGPGHQWPQLFSYDDQWQPIQADASAEASVMGSGDTLLPERIEGNALLTLLRRPWAVHVTNRLGIHYVLPEEVVADAEPFELDSLERHLFKRRMLDAVTRGDSLVAAAERERLSGNLPSLGFGEAWLEELMPRLVEQRQRWQQLQEDGCALPAQPFEGHYHDMVLSGRIEGLWHTAEGRVVMRLEAGVFGDVKRSRDGSFTLLGKPRRLLALYTEQLMAAVASGEQVTAQALFEDRLVRLPAVTPELAGQQLNTLVGHWTAAWQAPFPSVFEAAMAWLGAVDDASGLEAARALYEDGSRSRQALRDEMPELAELWPDFKALEAAGFKTASDALYRPIFGLIEAQLA